MLRPAAAYRDVIRLVEGRASELFALKIIAPSHIELRQNQRSSSVYRTVESNRRDQGAQRAQDRRERRHEPFLTQRIVPSGSRPRMAHVVDQVLPERPSGTGEHRHHKGNSRPAHSAITGGRRRARHSDHAEYRPDHVRGCRPGRHQRLLREREAVDCGGDAADQQAPAPVLPGKDEQRKARNVSNAEINRELTALKRMFSLAMESGKLLHTVLGTVARFARPRAPQNRRKLLKSLERETGIEPATSGLGSLRSTAELLPQTAVVT